MGYVLEWAINLQYNHSKTCTLGKLSIKEEIRRGKGLASTIIFECNSCTATYQFDTEDPKREKSLITVGAVWGTLASGSSFQNLNELLSCMDVPMMPSQLFYEIEHELGKVTFTLSFQ